MGGDHTALRRWASRWRGRCHTDWNEMQALFSEGSRRTDAGRRAKTASLGVPLGIGMPQRIPKIVEVAEEQAAWTETEIECDSWK